MNGDDEKRKFFVKEEFVEWAAEAFAKAMKQATETIEWLERREIDLSVAKDADPISMIPPMGYNSGNYIKVISCDGEASLRLDTQGDQEFDVSEHTELRLLFHQVYVTNIAQSGKKLVLSLGRGDFGFPEAPEKKGAGGVIIASTLETDIDGYADYSFPWFDASNYIGGRVILACHTTGGSIANGLEVQQSIDETQMDVTSPFTIVANVGQGVLVEIVARYVRIRYRRLAGHVRLVARASPTS